MDYSPICMTEIQFLSKKLTEEFLIQIENRNIVFIMSKSSAERWNFVELLQQIMKKNEIIWLNEVSANPTQIDILKALNIIGNSLVDLIIAVGGGSTIDLAKGISAFYQKDSNTPELKDIVNGIEMKRYVRSDFIDIIAIPTTAGTGSELTQWATIWDMDHQAKYSIDHCGLKPKKAIIIPELTISLSKELTLATGLDALAHAMEAYWSKHTNPLVQDLALRSVQLIVEYLPKVLHYPESFTLREGMCRASVLAGIAFSMTRTTACHSISYPLTMLYGVPHGIAAAMTLGEIAKRNRGNYPNDTNLEEIFQTFGGIQQWLDFVSQDIIKLRLSAFQITIEDIDIIVERAFTSGRMDNNPVNLTEDDVREVLLNILN